MKRATDFMLAVVLLIMLSPVLVVVAMAILVVMGRPVFFVQQRVGFHGKRFMLLKFRTMRNTVDHSGQTIPDKERLTAFGQALRATSLDELPELWNILKGDMSLVGPRPLLVEYLPLYTVEQARRHEVRPGITGWAQVNGRNGISWEEKFRLDVWYVDNRSLILDIGILLKTALQVLKRDGISATGEATMPKFTGTIAPGKESKSK